MELSVFAEQAIVLWSMLRRHGSDIDGFSGTALPIRYEALRMACDRSPAGDELLWRISVIDGVYVDEQAKKRKKEEKQQKRSSKR